MFVDNLVKYLLIRNAKLYCTSEESTCFAHDMGENCSRETVCVVNDLPEVNLVVNALYQMYEV